MLRFFLCLMNIYIITTTDGRKNAAWVVNDKKDYSHVFQSLIAVQSVPYHVFKDYERDPYRRILNSLVGLRQLGRPEKITDWETFL